MSACNDPVEIVINTLLNEIESLELGDINIESIRSIIKNSKIEDNSIYDYLLSNNISDVDYIIHQLINDIYNDYEVKLNKTELKDLLQISSSTQQVVSDIEQKSSESISDSEDLSSKRTHYTDEFFSRYPTALDTFLQHNKVIVRELIIGSQNVNYNRDSNGFQYMLDMIINNKFKSIVQYLDIKSSNYNIKGLETAVKKVFNGDVLFNKDAEAIFKALEIKFSKNGLTNRIEDIAISNKIGSISYDTELDIYIDYVFLKNIKNALSEVLPAIIKKFGSSKYSGYSYSFKSNQSTSSLFRTEDVDFSKETDDVIQLLINTTPLLNSRSKFITFNQVISVLSEVKSKINSPEYGRKNFENDEIYKVIGDKEFGYFYLKDLFATTHLDPIRGYQQLIPIIISEDNVLNLSTIQLNILESFYKHMLDPNNPKSIYSLSLKTNVQNNNYLNGILHFIVSVNPNIQSEFVDKKDGKGLNLHTIVSSKLSTTAAKIARHINASNSITSGKYEILSQKYPIEPFDKDKYKITIVDKTVKYNNNGVPISQEVKYGDSKYDSFILDVLGLDPTFYIQFDGISRQDLFNLATSVYGIMHLNKTKHSEVNNITKTSSHKISEISGGLDLVYWYSQRNLINLIASAQLSMDATGMSTIVTNSGGSDINTATLSRNIDKYHLFVSDVKSPLKYLEGLNSINGYMQTAQGISVDGEFKKFTDLSVSEMLTTMFTDTFLPAISGNKLDNIPIIPAVFSDKGTVGLLPVNLTKLYMKEAKTFADLITSKDGIDIERLNRIVARQFFKYYNAINSNVRTTWVNVIKLLSDESLVKASLGVDTIPQDLAQGIEEITQYINNYDPTSDLDNDIYSAISRYLYPVEKINGSVKNFVLGVVAAYNTTVGPDQIIEIFDEQHLSKAYSFDKIVPVGDGSVSIDVKDPIAPNRTLQALETRFSNPQYYNAYFEQQDYFAARDLLDSGASIPHEWGGIFMDENIVVVSNLETYNGKLTNKRLVKITEIPATATINQYLRAYNRINYFFGQQFSIANVGTHTSHPAKLKWNKEVDLSNPNDPFFIQEENNRQLAQNKRNSMFVTTAKPYTLGIIGGIQDNANVVYVEDVYETVHNVIGQKGVAKPHDGATLVSPIQSRAEAKSIGNTGASVIKKPIFINNKVEIGTGQFIKTAGFSITNELARIGIIYRSTLEKMMNLPWRTQDGEILTDFNILRSINFNTGTYIDSDVKYEYRDPNRRNGVLWAYRNGDEIVEVTNIEYAGNNTYNLTYRNFYPESKTTSDDVFTQVTINSNKDLWNLFGGYRSVSYENSKYSYSEHSMEALYKAAVITGFIHNEGTPIITNREYFSPMFKSDIAYLATQGAMKTGSANINSSSTVYDPNDTTPLVSFKMSMVHSGEQLDKEHHADDSRVSIMTQVISLVSSRGYSYSDSIQLYKVLGEVVNQGLNESLTQLEFNDEASIEYFKRTLAPIVLDAVINFKESDTAFVDYLKNKIAIGLEQGVDPVELLKQIPVDAPDLKHKIPSDIAVALNKFIKLKLPGSLNILAPAHHFIKIHGGRMLNEFHTDEELEAYQTELDEKPITKENIHQIQIGNSYKVKFKGDDNIRTIRVSTIGYTQKDNEYGYHLLANQLRSGEVEYLIEDAITGRELAHYDVLFTTSSSTGTRQFRLYDLDSVQALMEAFENNNVSEEEIKLMRRKVQEDLSKLSDEFHDNRIISIRINGVASDYKIVGKSVEKPAEVILPKMFKTKFGLDTYDSLYDIQSKRGEFFLNKIARNVSKSLTGLEHSYEVKHPFGNHFYVGSLDQYDEESNVDIQDYTIDVVSKNEVYAVVDGVRYRLSSTEDIVAYDTKTKTTIIYAKDPLQVASEFAKDNDYIAILPKNDEAFETLQQSGIKNFETLAEANSWKNMVSLFHETIKSSSSYLVDSNLYKYVNEIYNSFEVSLNTIASRTPAQSLQSIMPMRIVGFIESDQNVSYVSATQLWLQGSDFDIDTANFLSYHINKSGKLETWSALTDFSSPEMLKASMELPFPSLLLDLPDVENTTFTFDISDLFDSEGNIDISTPERMRLFAKSINHVIIYGIDSLTYKGKGDFDQYSTLLDIHASTFDNANSETKQKAMINFIVSKLYKITSDPMNQIYAQVPIDDSTKEIKTLANDPSNPEVKKSTESNPGNFVSVLAGIRINHDGKDSLSIAAVGLKTFFALTNYYNSVLNSPTSTEADLSRLLFGPNGKGIAIDGVTYRTLPNIYRLGTELFSRMSEEEFNMRLANLKDSSVDSLREFFDVTDRDSDAVTTLSVLLSQAVDNAKELSLGKINAGPNMVSYYIYGTFIGVPIKTLVKIMTSPQAKRLSELSTSNIMSEDDYNVFNPFSNFENVKDTSFYKGIKKGQNLSLVAGSISIVLGQNTGKRSKGQDIYDFIDKAFLKGIAANQDVNTIAQNLFDTFRNRFIDNYKKVKPSLSKNEDTDLTTSYHTFLNNLTTILNNLVTVKYSNLSLYEDLKTLYEGAQEAKLAGQILGINKGIKNTTDEIIRYEKAFNRAVGLSVIEVVSDLDNAIEVYESKKHTFNIMAMIKYNPHILAYIKTQALHTKFSDILLSKKRAATTFVEKLDDSLGKAYGVKLTKRVVAIEEAMEDLVIANWLNSPSFRMIKVDPPVPYTVYVNSDTYNSMMGTDYAQDTMMKIPLLGTDEGAKAFKMWMENVVVPSLKSGINNLSEITIPSNLLKENPFIQNLQFESINKSAMGDSFRALTPNIDMNPKKSDTVRQAQLADLKFHYNNLINQPLTTYFVDQNGQIHYLQDLFTLYNILVYKNKRNVRSFTTLLSDYTNNPVLRQYFEYYTVYMNNIEFTEDTMPANYVESYAISRVTSTYRQTENKILVKRSGELNYSLFIQNIDHEGNKVFSADSRYVTPLNSFRGSINNYGITLTDFILTNGKKSLDITNTVITMDDISKFNIELLNPETEQITKYSVVKKIEAGDTVYLISDGVETKRLNRDLELVETISTIHNKPVLDLSMTSKQAIHTAINCQ